MSLYQYAMEQTLCSLQESASRCAELFCSYRTKVIYRVFYATGVEFPWRLIETIEFNEPDKRVVLKRKMHCFENQLYLRKSITERILWKGRDKAFTRTHLVASRDALSRDPALSPADKARDALNVIERDLGAIEGERRRIRESICLTQASRVIDMLAPRSSAAPCG